MPTATATAANINGTDIDRTGAYHPFDPGAALAFALAIAEWAADVECRKAMEGNHNGQPRETRH